MRKSSNNLLFWYGWDLFLKKRDFFSFYQRFLTGPKQLNILFSQWIKPRVLFGYNRFLNTLYAWMIFYGISSVIWEELCS